MYYYVYDEFIQDPKFERDLALIETRLTDLGISGKIARLALFRDPVELIRDEVRKGAQTVVAVGNDITLRKVIDAVADSGVVIGIIPMGTTDNQIAEILGVPAAVAACDVLSSRIIEQLDVGVINGQRFLNEVIMPQTSGVTINCDDKYKIQTSNKGTLTIRNLALASDELSAANPTDNQLEIVVQTQKRNWFGKKSNELTIVPVKKASIEFTETVAVTVDGEPFEGKEFHLSVMPGRLKVVTGKNRKF